MGNTGTQDQAALALAGAFGSGFMGDVVLDGVTGPPPTSQFMGAEGLAMVGPAPVAGTPGVTQSYGCNCDLNCHNLTIDAGVLLTLQGDRLCVAGTLTVDGILDFQDLGSLSANGSAGGDITGSTLDPAGQTTAGGSGTTGAGGAGVRPADYSPTGAGTYQVAAGGRGGKGGAGAGGAGGTQPTILNVGEVNGLPYNAPWGFQLGLSVPLSYLGGSSGSAGGGDGTNEGGGGGSGGGLVVVAAALITGTGIIRSSGGNGGTPSAGNCGAGAGGGGGLVIITTKSAVWNPETQSYSIPGVTVEAPAGAPGTPTGTGSAATAAAAGNVVIIPG